MRLWQILVVTTILLSGTILSNREASQISKNPQQDEIKTIKQTRSFLSRDVLTRDSRSASSIEIYYGKPGIFSLEEIIKSMNLTVYPEDIVKTFPNPSFGIGSQITIYRSTPVILSDANNKTVYRTFKGTIKELLEEKGIILGEQDRIEPAISASLTKNLEIKITRVLETQVREKISIDFKTIKKEDPNLAWGKTNILQEGEKGAKERVYKVKRENGAEISRVLLEERNIKEPKNQITVVGTKPLSMHEGWASWWNGVTASRDYKKGTKLKVTNLGNGKSVIVIVGGYGPTRLDRIIDLNINNFAQIAHPYIDGVIRIRVEEVG